MDDLYVEKPELVQTNGDNPQNNTLGVTGLVTGILGLIFAFCCSPLGVLLGIVALICGIIASGRQQKFAVAGIVLGGIALVVGIIVSVLILPLVFVGFFEAFAVESYSY